MKQIFEDQARRAVALCTAAMMTLGLAAMASPAAAANDESTDKTGKLQSATAAQIEPAEHPQIFLSTETDARLDNLLESEDWAAASFDAITDRIEPLVDRHQTDPEWILSRMGMFWTEGERYTQVYIADERFDYAEGNAPVPTVRYPAMRIWNDNKNAPLEDRLPYSADGSMMNQNGEVVPYEETGHMVRLNNEEILSLAQEAAFLYHVTEDEKYAEFGADIYWQWLLGVYYMNPALDPEESLGGPGGYEPGGIGGYYDYEVIHDPMGGQAAVVYDYLFDYLEQNPDPHLDEIGRDFVDVSSEVFKRFIDIGMVRGAKASNWNVNGWKCIIDAVLALETNDYYADGKGREYYLHYYTTETTEYHNALPDILLEYDQTTGLWPESPGYASGMVAELLNFAAPIYSNGIDTIGDYPMLEKAALAVNAWLDDRGSLVVFGDGRGGQPSYAPFERLNWYYQEVGNDTGAATVSTAIRNAIEAGLYDRSALSFRDLLYSAPLVESTDGAESTQTAYSPNHRHMVQRNGEGSDNALMATLYGGFNEKNHLTANGLAAQIYGKGWATAPQTKSYESYWSDDITYSRHEAGANTVVPGYNHGEITVNALDPAVPEDALTNPATVSPLNSFADVSAEEHRRQLAIVRTSPTTGYYVDVFRADQEDSDYIWHALGDRVELFGAEGEALETSAADDLGAPVPSYRFFSDPAKADYADDLHARWTVDDGVSDGVDLVTDMWMPGEVDRGIYTVTAPATTIRDNITPGNVNAYDDPTNAVIVRQNGTNAAEAPFAAVFESTGSDELSITDVSTFGEGETFNGLEVESAELDERVDRVFTSTSAAAIEPVAGSSFAGFYGVSSYDAEGFVSAYLGSGTQLMDRGTGVTLDATGAAWLEATEEGYTFTATQAGTIRVPLGDGQATVEVDGVVVEATTDDDSLLIPVPAGTDMTIEVSYAPKDVERPVATLVSPTSDGPFSSVSIQVDATDNAGLQRIVANIYRDGVLVKSTQSSVADGATTGSHTATVELPEGDYSIKYNAQDLAGNIARTGVAPFTIDGTAPTASVKEGSNFTVLEGAGYQKVSFKLFDAGGVDRVEINGKVKDLANNKWSDVNFLAPGVFGSVKGENTLVVYDVAGNASTTAFTLE